MTGACKRPPTRPEVLEALVREQVVPDIRELAGVNEALTRASRALEKAPSAARLESVRAAFRQTLLAWERAHTFRVGPLVDSNAFLRAAFWPVRGDVLEPLITGSAPLDAAAVGSLGVDGKGLFALERLLWDGPPGAPLWLEGPHQARARNFARLLAEDVEARAAAGLKLLGDGRAFARSFAADGQASLTRLVTHDVETLESIVVDRLQRGLALQQQGRLRPGEVPADLSGLSLQVSAVQLEALQGRYAGRDGLGLEALVVQAAPALAPRIRAALDQALSALRALSVPLLRVLAESPARVEHALAQVKAVEVAYKSELATALAVTLALTAGDGD